MVLSDSACAFHAASTWKHSKDCSFGFAMRKRKRVDLCGQQKQEICRFKQENPKATQESIVEHFQKKWKLNIGRSSVSEILSCKEKWLNLEDGQKRVKRFRSGRFSELETDYFYVVW